MEKTDIVYLECVDHPNSKNELKSAIDYLFSVKEVSGKIGEMNNNISEENLIFCAIYSQTEVLADRDTQKIETFANLHVVDETDMTDGLENAAKQAEEVFKKMFPDEIFLDSSKLRKQQIERFAQNDVNSLF